MAVTRGCPIMIVDSVYNNVHGQHLTSGTVLLLTLKMMLCCYSNTLKNLIYQIRLGSTVCIKLVLCRNILVKYIKSIYFKNVLDKINLSKNLQKLPHPFLAVREGRFCKFLDNLILSSTFLIKTDFSLKRQKGSKDFHFVRKAGPI